VIGRRSALTKDCSVHQAGMTGCTIQSSGMAKVICLSSKDFCKRLLLVLAQNLFALSIIKKYFKNKPTPHQKVTKNIYELLHPALFGTPARPSHGFLINLCRSEFRSACLATPQRLVWAVREIVEKTAFTELIHQKILLRRC